MADRPRLTDPDHELTDADKFHIGSVIVSMLADDEPSYRDLAITAIDASDGHERWPDPVILTHEQAEAVLARIAYYVENNDESVDDTEREAYAALGRQLGADS